MSPSPSDKDPKDVQAMFSRIAARYDLMNRLMTGWQDLRWRKIVVQQAVLPEQARVLDLGAGTGDLSREVLRQHPTATAVAADFTLEMMRVGKSRPETQNLSWTAGDALRLPFPDNTFHAVVSGFLLRNVADLPTCLKEQRRVLKPGGWMVALDTTRPVSNIFTPLIKFYMRTVIPFLGRLLTGQKEAYRYLPESSEAFLRAEELAAHLAAAGFKKVLFRRYMFETIAIHWGQK
jgi:demethylmenaquinone methyltransferase/2-methoxy-6-polyprenyl-1,4-benzoquinol methylase